jgi:ADP-ribose pyrophosphatase
MAADRDVDIKIPGTRLVYENRWMRVREDAVRRRDGSEGIYDVIEKSDFLVIVPLEEGRGIHLVQQYRYPVGAQYWEFPQGSWEQPPKADPTEVARSELHEETGLVAANTVHAGHLFEAYAVLEAGIPRVSRNRTTTRRDGSPSRGARPRISSIPAAGA